MNDHEFLTELRRRQDRVERPRPALLISADIRFQRKRGPHYHHREWFGACDPAKRNRIVRTIGRLEKSGRITVHRRGENRISNVRLTEAGRQSLSQPPKGS